MEGSDSQPPKPPELPGKKPGASSVPPQPKDIPIAPDPAVPPTPKPKPSLTSSTPPPEPKAVGDLVFRTMKDDLATGSSTPAPPPPSAAPATPPSAAPQAFPLPPRSIKGGDKVVMEPKKQGKRQRKKKGKGWLILLVLLLLLAIAAAVAAWLLLNPQQSDNLPTIVASPNPTGGSQASPSSIVAPTPSSDTTVAAATDVLPGDASVIVQYRLSSVTDRSNLLSQWNRTGAAPSVTGLLQGDPRLLLDDPEITELYYVSLDKEPRPYLLAPKTTLTTQLLIGTADARTVERNGWYIAHSLDTASYTTALETTSLAAIGSNSILTDQTPETPLRVILGTAALRTVRGDVLAPEIASGQLQLLSLTLSLNQSTSAQVSGQGTSLNPAASQGASNQQLLSLVPSSASFVRLGNNFAADSNQWQSTVGVLDDKFFGLPEVSALRDQHNTPYAFFIDALAGGGKSYGFIIERPAGSTLALDSPDLASALTSLVPLLTGQPRLVPLEFNSGIYANTPLKFANLAGSTQAVDVALTQTHVLIATSKDTMFNLITTAADPQFSISTYPAWTELLNAWGTPATSNTLIMGALKSPQVLQLLPSSELLRFGLTLEPQPASASWQAAGTAILDTSEEIQNPF